jgi:mono/diheme cytochrome c family protein
MTLHRKNELPADRWRRRFWIVLAIAVGIPLLIGIWAAARFLPNRPVVYSDIEEHFKYGSTGGEASSGFPYWIWQALPVVFRDHLPQNGGQGYEAFGMIFEKNKDGKPKDLPIGVMKGHNLGIDRVFVNCAVCHVSTVRGAPDQPARVYLGMGAARFDLGAFEQFLFDCAADERFRAEDLVPAADRLSGGLGLVDRYIVYPVAIAIMRERLMMLRHRFGLFHPERWGPGRVDTFNSAKALFNFPFEHLPAGELNGAADFPSIWDQGQRKRLGIHAHWDGNNASTEERNKSAAFGTGTTPATIDLDAIARLETWLADKKAPPYPFPIDKARADRGAPLYKQYCAGCHGVDGRDFTGAGAVVFNGGESCAEPFGRAQYLCADPGRLDSYTRDLALNQSTLYAGMEYEGKSIRFQNFRKTFGYANLPLDGIWLRAPYLHNGSVPTLRDLLNDAAERPKAFFRGDDVYDQVNGGFVSSVPERGGRRFFRFDTRCADAAHPAPADAPPCLGNGNQGHEGAAYGTKLAPVEKDALVEYLKTFGGEPAELKWSKP